MFAKPHRNYLLTGVGTLAMLALAMPIRPTSATTNVTSTFTVSANVQATCLISAGNMSFGTYTGTQVDATSSIHVTCTSSTPYDVALDAGGTTGATVTTRQLQGAGSAVLDYALYSDSVRSINWGNTLSIDTQQGTGSGSTQTMTVYGRLPGSQYIVPGGYTDTVTATVMY